MFLYRVHNVLLLVIIVIIIILIVIVTVTVVVIIINTIALTVTVTVTVTVTIIVIVTVTVVVIVIIIVTVTVVVIVINTIDLTVTVTVTVIIRDLKIRGRDKLRRLPEVNLHNEACAHEAQTRVLAVLVSPRTPFSLFCRRLENVSSLGLFSPTIRRYRFPFQIF